MEVKSRRPTAVDYLRDSYDNVYSLREYFSSSCPEVQAHIRTALESIRCATVTYQKNHCSEELGWGVLPKRD